MARYELLLPKMGESVAEATVTSWLRNVGDQIEEEDGILEIATDKVDSEVPSPVSGILVEQLVKQGEIAKIGRPVAILETPQEASEMIESEPHVGVVEENEQEASPLIDPSETVLPNQNFSRKSTLRNTEKPSNSTKDDRFYSPLVKSIIKKESISTSELRNIVGTGKNGRLTKDDILKFVSERKPAPDSMTKVSSTVIPVLQNELETGTAAHSSSGAKDIIEMDRMRKMIADNMLKSKQKSPHVTSVVEIDVTNLVKWRERVKVEFEKREGEKLTFTPIFVEAIAKALRDFPMVNVSVEGNNILVKKDINVGIAVALPTGNLIVPVVHNADQLNMIGLAKRVNQLSSKARVNKLKMEDISGGTFTLTNIGTFGNTIGTPIINQPEVAIMAAGAIQKKPAVIETEEGDSIGIRQLMFLSMSYDHRVVDGMLGGSFLRRVGDYLEKFDFNRQIW